MTDSHKIILTPEKIAEIKLSRAMNYFPHVKYKFIVDHKGFRPSMCHLLLGTTGTGKSTLARSIMLEQAEETRIFWYSSEESMDDFTAALLEANTCPDLIDNIRFAHEEEYLSCKSVFAYVKKLEHDIVESNAQMLYFDNITTSSFYDGTTPETQVALWTALQNLCKKLKMPFFFIGHTQAGISDAQSGFIRADNIRGNKAIPNKCEFLYIYQRPVIIDNDKELFFPFLRVEKSRTGNNSQKVYALNYNTVLRSYVGDKEISMQELQSVYEKIVRLSNGTKQQRNKETDRNISEARKRFDAY